MGNKKSIFAFGTAALILYILFPIVAGYVYKSSSDPIEIEEKRKEYWELTDYTDKNTTNSQAIYERRIELILWMRVRYLPIDEGHISPTMLERWKVLFEYWKLEPKEKE
jgi:hypothetical protein